MTFVLDHAPSKYVQIEIILTKYGYIYGVFSRAAHQKSHYFVHSVSTQVLEVRYSCYYVLLILPARYQRSFKLPLVITIGGACNCVVITKECSKT